MFRAISVNRGNRLIFRNFLWNVQRIETSALSNVTIIDLNIFQNVSVLHPCLPYIRMLF